MASGLTVARLMASFITSAPKICAGIEARAPPCLAIGVRTADTITASLFISASTPIPDRSEEHTSELQSRGHLVCRLLLEKKTKKSNYIEYVIISIVL